MGQASDEYGLLSSYEAKFAALQAQLDSAYSQRNALAVAFAKAAIAAGWNAGRGYDDCPEKGWDPEWRHVVYVDLPTGEQVSWHMGPADVQHLDDLPQYNGKWDGTTIGRNLNWCRFTWEKK